ncbi:hypothetical protein DES53_103442 [Roseimicrobium gellanilyticum]|uniref:Uncharacterized protein n=1 Tax=Roseimicrobium gellanilyticum TaxID=748857 RepID=A0A366HSC3_9BACT|nr:hypothetical protein [Roseimicrobium gellanilyticum]RBP45442.1 hypothetical protein DES53_103442 [Roseimicrobium gellanilyticum]
MNNIVRFSVGCMGLIMVGFVVVMYFGMRDTAKTDSPEEQAKARVRQWMDRLFNNAAERELVTLGREYTFEGEDKSYRLADLRRKDATDPTAVERYVLLTRPDGTVTYHWTVAEFTKEKKEAGKAEATPERAAWQEKRWLMMLKEMGLEDKAAAPSPAAVPAAIGK